MMSQEKRIGEFRVQKLQYNCIQAFNLEELMMTPQYNLVTLQSGSHSLKVRS